MSKFVQYSYHLREVLLHYFIYKKTAAESHCILVKIYGEHALLEISCKDWFRWFESGNFELSNKYRGKPPRKFENGELHALLDGNSTQRLKQLAEVLQVDRELFPDVYMQLEKSRKKENRFRTN